MKRLYFIAFVMVVSSFVFFGCKNGDDSPEIAPVKVTGIALNPSTLDLTVGGTAGTLTATIQPSDAAIKDVVWESSDPAVATVVPDGLTATVTPVGVGTVTITVTTVDGQKAAECGVMVKAASGGDGSDPLSASLVKFNLGAGKDVSYDGTGEVGDFGNYGWLLYPKKIDLENDNVVIQAKIKFTATSGHNGVGFINANNTEGKAYSLVTAQNIKNNLNGGGGSSFSPAVTWTVGKEYIFRAELAEKRINFYVFEEGGADGLTQLGYKQGAADTATTWYTANDTVYAAVGGSQSAAMRWSEIKVTFNGEEYFIDSLQEQSVLPSLSVSETSLRISKDAPGSVTYTATQPGGASAGVTAVSSDPSILRVDSFTGGTITFTGLKAGTAEITVTNRADTSLATKIQVTVTDFSASDEYGALTSVYPASGAKNAYTDGELMITFDNAPLLVTGGSIGIYDKATGTAVDTIAFADEEQAPRNWNTIKVGAQLVRKDGNSIYFTPHFEKLAYGKEYYIAIPRNSITAQLNGKNFVGFTDNKDAASWSFTTKASPALNATITVDGSQTSTADFRTVQGALLAIASNTGDYTINIAKGTYTELIHYKGSANVTLVGQGTAKYGADVVIQYTNCNDMNSSTHTRASAYFSGINVVLKNLTLKNTTVRGTPYLTGVTPSSNSQAESIFFANGTGKTLAAYNCSFRSHQDTIQTTGKNWFYQSYIEGDTDYIWGTADACLIEECELVSLNDPLKSTKEAILLVARTGSTAATTVPKGYVILNSKVTVQDGIATYFGRNPGAGAYYDQCAVINTIFTLEGTGSIGAGIWRGSTYTYLEGAEEHVGWKVYGNTVAGKQQDVSAPYAHSTVMAKTLYESEYSGRNVILNRVYTKANGTYAAASSNIWNLASLETDFSAVSDPGTPDTLTIPAAIFGDLRGKAATTGGWADRANDGGGLSYAEPAAYTLIDDAAYAVAADKRKAFTDAINAKPAAFIIVSGDIDLSDGKISNTDHRYFDTFKTNGEREHGDITYKVSSNKTIIGIDNARIMFGGLQIKDSSNIIIRNVAFYDAHGSTDRSTVVDPDSKASIDALVISGSSDGVWVDHCTFTDGVCNDMIRNYNHDGAFDIPKGKNITVSWCDFTNHDKVMLVASSDNDANAVAEDRTITLHHNYFHGTTQRMPRCRGTLMHLYNNYYDNIGVSGNAGYSLGPGFGSQFIVENNNFGSHLGTFVKYYDKSAETDATFSRFYHSGNSPQLGVLNCSYDNSVENVKDFTKHEIGTKPWTIPYAYTLESASGLSSSVLAGAGSGHLVF
jgi:pectate lyase/uncharacterized protein YjdB